LILGDSLEKLKLMDENSVDSIVTDPPWAIKFMSKHWDYQIPSVEIWREVMRVLKPGGHALICCGTRTQHRMVVNVEDAGFEVRDVICHLYGSGFPKSHNVSVAIDKLLGHERKVVGYQNYSAPDIRGNSYDQAHVSDRDRLNVPITEPSTDAAKKYAGWGTALKPAVEFWTLARKPLSERTVALNVLKWGCGGLNIDASRIGSTGGKPDVIGTLDYQDKTDKNGTAKFRTKNVVHGDVVQGRFPANILLDESAAQLLDEQSGVLKNGGQNYRGGKRNSMFGNNEVVNATQFAGDTGGASRFFYCAKSSKSERNAGCEGMPTKPMNTYNFSEDGSFTENHTAKSGKAERRDRQNHHPCVKPIKLMEYLITLITPSNGTCLDPFMGSGSTGVACKRLGFDFIGVELNAEYMEIAKARIG
jgi:DNA modification methylase